MKSCCVLALKMGGIKCPVCMTELKPMTNRLDTFTRAYLECALWSSIGDDDTPLDGAYSVSDIHPASVLRAIAECKAFRETNADILARANDDDSQHGHDFWLTRNGHGAGFWDRGYPKELGQYLTDKAHAFGELHLYVGDDGELRFE